MTEHAAIDYAALLRDAGRDVIRRVLTQVAAEGLPGEHHFYLTFDTTHPELEMAPALRRQHPETMTVVLQQQFWELAVDDEAFAVTLRFGGRYQRLRVPFAALTTFVDPAAEFALHLAVPAEPEPAAEEAHQNPDAAAPAAPGNLLHFDRTAPAEDE
ncbi:MAG: ClpXP protease specificity-enhancing factor SspB [Thermoanaerobaculia bacterium]